MIRKSIISAGFGAGVLEYAAEHHNNPDLRLWPDQSDYTPDESAAFAEYRREGYSWAKAGGLLRMPEGKR